MSLILEALRKSEAERRRGETPGLRAELPPAAVRPRRTVPAWGWVAIAAVALLLALAAFWPRDEGQGDDREAATTPAGDTTVTVAPQISSTRPPAPTGRDALPEVDRIEPRDPAPVAAPTRNTDTAPGAPVVERPAAVPPQSQAPTTPTPTLPAPIAAPDTTPARTPAAPPAGDLPRLSELAPAQRKRLPAMKLSMHMWNADPARRFVIIDGHRQVEGDRVGDATITAIDADGVVLELDGRPVRVPLR